MMLLVVVVLMILRMHFGSAVVEGSIYLNLLKAEFGPERKSPGSGEGGLDSATLVFVVLVSHG